MDVDQVKQAIEDFLESSVQFSQFEISVFKENGDSYIIIERRDDQEIASMYELSEIINAYSVNWKVTKSDRNKLQIVIY